MRTELCEKFGIEYPVFGFTPSEHVAAAISRAGGLGVLGCVRFNDADELDAVNRALAGRTTQGEAPRTLAAGLVTRDRRTIYRIEDDIPVMLADESIAVAEIADFPES